jgi:hypothetical protein
LELRHVLAVVVGVLGLHELHLLDERGLLELADEAGERLDVHRIANDAEMHRVARDHGAERLPFLLAALCAVGRGDGGDRGDGLLGLSQTCEAKRHKPRIRRQRLADFVHDVRPDETVVVDGANQVERAQDGIALGFRLVMLLQHGRVARGVLDSLLQRRLDCFFRAGLTHVQQRDDRDGHHGDADGADEPRLLHPLAHGGHRRGHVDRRATATPGTPASAGEQIDFDHRVASLMRPGAGPGRWGASATARPHR